MTPRDICALALKMCGALGVGQTALAEDINDAFSLLNMMIGQWAQKRWLVYDQVDLAFNATGALSYAIGPGATLNTARPDRIESAYARYVGGGAAIDYPLELIAAREDYDLLTYKTLPGFPAAIFYDSGYPQGSIYVYPVPSAGFQIHLLVKQPISSFSNLSDQINLPAEYYEALLYNLAGRLRPMYQLPPDPTVTALAVAALNTIRNSNAQVGRLTMPGMLPGTRFGSIGSSGLTSVITVPSGGLLSGIGVIDGGSGNGGTDSGYSTTSVLGLAVLGRMVLGSTGGSVSGTSVLGAAVLDEMVLGT